MFGNAARPKDATDAGDEVSAPNPDRMRPEPLVGAAPEMQGFGSKDPAERTMALCDGLIDVAAALFNVSGRELRQPGRTTHGVSRVRQIAMYIAHTIFGIKMSEVGRCFGRDRTTVLHACHVIEDMRDDEDFEQIVATTERVALAAFGSRAAAEGRI